MKLYKRIRCADGASVSIQAGETMYSTPREDNAVYTHVEAGFPSEHPPDSWMEFCGDQARPTETVYGYLPVALVREFITAHGGVVDGELPAGVTDGSGVEVSQ